MVNKISVLQNLKNVYSDPYPHIIIKNCLPKKIHNELLDTLPDKKLDEQEPKDKYNKLTWHVNEIREENWPISNIWKEFIEYHCSQEYFDNVLNIFDKWADTLPLPKKSIRLEDRSKNEDTPKSANCYTDFNFVKHPTLNNVSTRTPHCDNEKEIYASLLYLKYPQDQSTGGGFNIHQANNLKMFEDREFKYPGPIIRTCPYESNNFVMLLNNKHAQHSVEPRQNTIHPRWSINMIGRYTGSWMWKI